MTQTLQTSESKGSQDSLVEYVAQPALAFETFAGKVFDPSGKGARFSRICHMLASCAFPTACSVCFATQLGAVVAVFVHTCTH